MYMDVYIFFSLHNQNLFAEEGGIYFEILQFI